jgi:hypothetical protein
LFGISCHTEFATSSPSHYNRAVAVEAVRPFCRVENNLRTKRAGLGGKQLPQLQLQSAVFCC